MLKIKNPRQIPITMVPNTTTSFTSKIIAITVKQVITTADMVGHKPSTPSVKLMAFVVAKITKIANGIYSQIGNVIYILTIGINVSHPKSIILIK